MSIRCMLISVGRQASAVVEHRRRHRFLDAVDYILDLDHKQGLAIDRARDDHVRVADALDRSLERREPLFCYGGSDLCAYPSSLAVFRDNYQATGTRH